MRREGGKELLLRECSDGRFVVGRVLLVVGGGGVFDDVGAGGGGGVGVEERGCALAGGSPQPARVGSRVLAGVHATAERTHHTNLEQQTRP